MNKTTTNTNLKEEESTFITTSTSDEISAYFNLKGIYVEDKITGENRIIIFKGE